MSTLRRLLPPLAALLAVLVVVQTTDLLACADEAVTAESTGTHADRLANGVHPVPAPGDSHDGGHGDHEGTFADCLCHVVFAPTTIVPVVGARPTSGLAAFAHVVGAPSEVEPSGLDHVPLG